MGWQSFKGVPQCPIARSSLCRHSRQHGHRFIDVIDDDNLGLSAMLAMQAANILGQSTFPGNGHRQEERVEFGIVEAFPDVAPGRQDEAFLIIGYTQCRLVFFA